MDNLNRPQAHAVPEDEFNKLFDHCCADVAIKTLTGGVTGALFSLFKRRFFPIWLGMGFGLGAGYMSCQNKLRMLTREQDLQMKYHKQLN